MLKKLDIKSIFIIILGIALIISFLIGGKPNGIDKKQFDELHNQNKNLMLTNDSLSKSNDGINKELGLIQTELNKKNIEIETTNKEIDKLKKARIILKNKMKIISAEGIATGFNDYIERRDK